MLDTGALSPEVKKLFAQIAKQAGEYDKAFRKIDAAVEEFAGQRERMNADLERIRNEISDSINELDKHARDTIQEFSEKTETTHTLFTELDKIDKLKLELFDLRDEIKSQSIDLSNSLVEFNAKADKELANTIALIRKKLENTLDEQVGKIETKLARRIAVFEKNQKIFETRIRTIDSNIRGDVKKLAGEIDFVYNSINEIKADVANYFKPLIEKVEEFDREVPRISKLLDNVAAKVKDRLGSIADVKPIDGEDDEAQVENQLSTGEAKIKDDTPENYDAGDGNYDESSFDFNEGGYVTSDDLHEERPDDVSKMNDSQFREYMQEELDAMEEKAIAEMRKGTISIALSVISLLGLLLVLASQFIF